MNLVIVESPTKSRTLQGFLGPRYKVLSSYGHIRDLPEEELGVDIENNFKPKYVIPPKSKKVIQFLTENAQKAEGVILASVDYKEPILIQCPDNMLRQFEVGAFIDKCLERKIDFSLFRIPAFDFQTQKISFKPIKGISRHPIKEKLLEINLDYGRKIRITASHSVFTKNKKGRIKPIAGKDLKIGDRLLIPLKLPRNFQKIKEIDLLKLIYEDKELRKRTFISSPKVNQYRKGKVLAPKLGSIPQFQPRLILSSKLRKILKRKREKLASIEIAIKNALTRTWQPLNWFTWEEIEKNFREDRELRISRHNHSHRMPRFIPVNKELMLFLGFFVAEGSYLTKEKYVRFSFGNKRLGGEKENIERIKQISRLLFNLSPSDFEDGTTNSVVLHSTLVSFLLKKVLKIKGGAENKEVPWIVFNVPRPLQFAFLKGLFLGDGSLGKENITFNTVSPKLAHGIRLLFLQNGILTSHSLAFPKKPNRKPLHQIIISNKKRLLEIKSIWEEHYRAKILKDYLHLPAKNKKNWSLIQDKKENLGLLKIRAIRKIKPSNRFVYDFSVVGENFICGDGGICAHNTDQDREGEAIAWHLTQVLNLNGKKPYQRIVFHEITKSALAQALKNPRKVDMNLVDAQQARRVLDRLVGYKLSPFLWKKIARGLSAGRVQSVAVRLVVEREREIEKFVPQEYWTIEAWLLKSCEGIPTPSASSSGASKNQEAKSKNEFKAWLVKKDGKVIPKLGIKTKQQAEKIIKEIKGAEYKVVNIEKKEIKKYPLPPFTTSTLQQESWKRFKWPAKFTMRLAQQLYEKGLCTYHRTDSLNLAGLALGAAKKFITENYGSHYYQFRKYKAKGRVQEAHEAIRPTYADKVPEKIKLQKKLDENQARLYDLIWRRFIACQMKEASFHATSLAIAAKNYEFRASGQTLKFDGFLKVYPIKYEETELPPLEKEEILKLIKLTPSQHFTQPPARYTEATLIKKLESEGIGRPSTYAPIISTIQERHYIEKDEKKYFRPTEIGKVVNNLLVEHFPQIVDLKFTASMEKELDQIAAGRKKWTKVIKAFYQPFAENLKKKYERVAKKEFTEKPTKKKCKKCGAPLLIRLGKYGKFYACSKYPQCEYTESLPENTLGLKCPRCQEGQIVEKRTKKKKRKIFYGCNRFPKCDFALWDKPTGEKCPKCGSLLVQTKKGIRCSNKQCQPSSEKF